jgi:hypothetical protein
MGISTEALAQIEQTLRTAAYSADAEADGIEQAYEDLPLANRIRSIVLDLKAVAQTLDLTNLSAQITSLQDRWPYPHFDDEGFPTGENGQPLTEEEL